VKLEIEARFDDTEDTYVSIGEVIAGSGWAPEFILAGEWVTVEFHENGATMRVEAGQLQVPSGGEWCEGKLLGVLVRGRIR